MSNFQMTVNVMDRIISTSNILLDQNFNANDVVYDSNTTSFALKVWSNKIIDVDIILSNTLTVSWREVIRQKVQIM